jgi:hypothetical protein
MEDTPKTILKWTIAVIVLAGISFYAIQNVDDAFRAGIAFGEDDPSEAEQAELPSGPVANGEAPPNIDFALVGNAVSALTTDGMTVGPGATDGLVLSFPLIPGNPDCIATANLEVPIRQGTVPQPSQFAVYPSGIADLSQLADGAPVPEPIQINLNAPPLSAPTDGTPGPMSWDLTQMYRVWATSGNYDGGEAPAVGTPFTVVVRPNDQGQPGRTLVVASAESVDVKPRLIWTGVPDCGA